LCTLEFQDHRPLYDWCIDNLPVPAKPVQTEFSRLNLSHTVTSKRKLREIVEKNIVSGWDDPRMPTLSGMRNRGYPPTAIRAFCEAIGVSRADSVIDMSLLEECVRTELNQTAHRAFCVLDPITLVIESLPEEHHQILEVSDRAVILSREIYIDRNDFMQEPPKGYYRLSVGAEVRLRHAYVIKCHAVDYNDEGQIIRLRCTHDADTLGKNPEGRKVKGVIHWVSKPFAHPVKLYQYDRLFSDENPAREEDYLQFINQNSLQVHQGFAEHALATAGSEDIFQFERVGYYKVNQRHNDGKVAAFHRVVDLKNTWSKANEHVKNL